MGNVGKKVKMVAWDEGYDKGMKDWMIRYPCSICGRMVEVKPGGDCHKAVKRYMKEQGWGHGECHDRRRG